MLLPLLWFAVQANVPGLLPQDAPRARVDAQPVYSGVANETRVTTPRLAGRAVVDGKLDEPQWASAALLRGFSQYNPLDGRPAQDSTSVLVWYSSEAIYFGIRAWAPPGTVRGSLADRDKITNDDHVQIILDTFNDNRRAFVFAVNPLGIQSDGVRSEGGGGRMMMMMMMMGGGGGGGGGGFSRMGLSNADLSQDMIWESKGVMADDEYTVEVRIPFKALRFDPGVDTWGINLARTTQRNNFQDTWAPMRKGNSSMLLQSGRLTALHDLDRGLVLDVTPVATSLTVGAPTTIANTTDYRYTTTQQFGGDIRWGLRPNVTLNGTMRPDFSQVEADAGQLPGDVRFALFFPELRPFFVEGGENFDAPSQLVYTRNIVRPVGAAKLIGKFGFTDVAVLSAMDGKEYSITGTDNPLFNIVRIRRDLGSQSTLGFVLTDREEGRRTNRVAALDGRFLFSRVYSTAFQYGGSVTDSGNGSRVGRLWESSFDRSGRNYGFRNSIRALSEEFGSQAGFVSRNNIVETNLNQRYSWFGGSGSAVEQMMWYLSGQSLWTYGGFFDGSTAREARISLSTTASLRGGWSVSVTPALTTDQFDPDAYVNHYRLRPNGLRSDTVKYTPGGRVTSLQWQARIQTPQFQKWAANIQTTYGSDAEYLEAAQAQRLDVSATLDFRPTPQIRMTATMLHQEFVRARDSRATTIMNIPRIRVEYQLTRAILFRFVGQYENRLRDALRDPATEQRIVLRNANGTWTLSERTETNRVRADWLLAILPSPGRVIYVGYGASLKQTDPFSIAERPERTSDGLFVKVSYQLRIQ